MTEETTVLETPVYENRAFLFAYNAPEPAEGDVLLYQGELLNISELASAELLGVPGPIFSEGDEDYVPPVYNVEGKEYKTANAAAVDFIVKRLGDMATFAEMMRLTVFVIRRRVFDSPETPEALNLAAGRREEQNRKHGGPKHDDTHTVNELRGFMQDYFAEMERVFDEMGNGDVAFNSDEPSLGIITDKMIDIAALGIALLECGIRTRDRQTKVLLSRRLDQEGDMELVGAIEGRVGLMDGDEKVDPQGLSFTPYSEMEASENLVKVDVPGHGGVWMDKQEVEESVAHQERLLALTQIDSEEDYKVVMQLLEQMTDPTQIFPHENLADIEHLGKLANAYEIANGHEPQATTDAIFESREAANREE